MGLAGALQPAGRDVLGFAGAAGPPLIWSLAYIAAAATGAYEAAWASAPPFVAVVLLVGIVAKLSRGRVHRCACEGVADGR